MLALTIFEVYIIQIQLNEFPSGSKHSSKNYLDALSFRITTQMASIQIYNWQNSSWDLLRVEISSTNIFNLHIQNKNILKPPWSTDFKQENVLELCIVERDSNKKNMRIFHLRILLYLSI